MEYQHGLAMRKVSVCLSNVRIVTGRKICPDFYTYEKTFGLVFREEATHSTWKFGSTGPSWSEISDFEPIGLFARSASAVTPSEKSSFNLYYAISNEPKMIIVRCP